MRGQVIPNDNIAGPQSRAQHLFDKDLKDIGIRGGVHAEAGAHPVQGPGADQCRHLPVPEWNGPGHALTLRRTSIATRHRVRHAAFIDEHQTRWIECFHLGTPRRPLFLIGYCVAFGGVE